MIHLPVSATVLEDSGEKVEEIGTPFPLTLFFPHYSHYFKNYISRLALKQGENKIQRPGVNSNVDIKWGKTKEKIPQQWPAEDKDSILESPCAINDGPSYQKPYSNRDCFVSGTRFKKSWGNINCNH